MLKPNTLYIETTNCCNAVCVMCPHKYMRRKRGFMSDTLFELVLERCEESGWQDLKIFLHKEGEPLLDRKIVRRVAEAKKRIGAGNSIGLNTNAMLLDAHTAKGLLDAGLDEIYFSLDGVDAESYAKKRLNLDYEIVVRNIDRFFELRAQAGSNTKIVMQTLVESPSSPLIPVFWEQWHNRDCEIYIKRIHSYLDGGHSSFTDKLASVQINTCSDPSVILVIHINGKTGLCCWDYDNEYSPGSIQEWSLEELFNNQKARALREALASHNGAQIQPCNRCARIFGYDLISSPTPFSDLCKTK